MTPGTEAPALMDYSTLNWPLHVQSSGTGSDALHSLWTRFLKPCPAYVMWSNRITVNHKTLCPDRSGVLSPLLVACYNQLSDIFKYLLDAGADPAVMAQSGHNLFHLVGINGNERIARLLLGTKANLEERDMTDQTPLSYAAHKGHVGVVTTFLKAGANVDSRTKSNDTPLSYAASAGHLEVAQILLKEGADIESRGFYDRTPLHYAVWNGRTELVPIAEQI